MIWSWSPGSLQNIKCLNHIYICSEDTTCMVNLRSREVGVLIQKSLVNIARGCTRHYKCSECCTRLQGIIKSSPMFEYIRRRQQVYMLTQTSQTIYTCSCFDLWAWWKGYIDKSVHCQLVILGCNSECITFPTATYDQINRLWLVLWQLHRCTTYTLSYFIKKC